MTKDPSKHGLEPDSFSERLYTIYRSPDHLGLNWYRLNHAHLKQEWELDDTQYLEQIELARIALSKDAQDQPQ